MRIQIFRATSHLTNLISSHQSHLVSPISPVSPHHAIDTIALSCRSANPHTSISKSCKIIMYIPDAKKPVKTRTTASSHLPQNVYPALIYIARLPTRIHYPHTLAHYIHYIQMHNPMHTPVSITSTITPLPSRSNHLQTALASPYPALMYPTYLPTYAILTAHSKSSALCP
jgi:hypothetical protein